ncbi:hypothetical protein KWC93_001703 [Staphylococcus pseudintermedius]|nr:hypothetical protein [Staphylococcus pseudintermedius]
MKYYNSILELKEELNEEMQKEIDNFDLNNETPITLFIDKQEFAEYELSDGWYYDLFKSDYNGAPNPLDFIDYDEFSDALINSWDDNMHILLSNNNILKLEE